MLMILESMKMEIPIVAPCDGVVSHVLLDEGKRVSAGQVLVVMEVGV
jgi:urea carboxylase